MIRLFDKVMVEVKWLLPFYFFTFLPFSLSAQRLTVANTTVNAGRTGYLQPITATFELKNKSRKKCGKNSRKKQLRIQQQAISV